MILFAKLQATHDERTGSFGIVVTHLFANVIFKASVAVRSAAQSAYLTATGQRQSSVGVLEKQCLLLSVEGLFRDGPVLGIYISFVHRFGISIHTLGGYGCFGKITFTFGLVYYLIP